MMKDQRGYSEKEQRQITLCQRLISKKSYLCQEEIRRDLQRHGFAGISQSSVSRLLKILGAIKIRNARGQKIYALNPQSQPVPNAARSLNEMVVSVEHNGEFILIHTVAGYGRAVARVLDYHSLPDILGAIAGSSIVWVAPRSAGRIDALCRRINYLLCMHEYS